MIDTLLHDKMLQSLPKYDNWCVLRRACCFYAKLAVAGSIAVTMSLLNLWLEHRKKNKILCVTKIHYKL